MPPEFYYYSLSENVVYDFALDADTVLSVMSPNVTDYGLNNLYNSARFVTALATKNTDL